MMPASTPLHRLGPSSCFAVSGLKFDALDCMGNWAVQLYNSSACLFSPITMGISRVALGKSCIFKVLGIYLPSSVLLSNLIVGGRYSYSLG